ncbi:hypothetical protein ACFP6A_07700 [Quadrisphaera sp. GCM10027208]|uniref:hypothetical protein n=1 Tax=Quadrisphaera sp. GCM10027208 TaxID=3273423 RepID=UPI00362432C4
MAVDESSRHLLYEQAACALGTEAADVLMNHLPPAGWSDLARRGDVEHETALLRADLTATIAGVRTELRGDIAYLRTELKDDIAYLRTELKDDIAGVRTEVKDDIADLATRLETLRADLMAGMVTQTRWMIGVITVMTAIFTTATLLGR